MNPITMVGIGAGAVLVMGWLAVSFSAPSRRREVVEWLSATSLFTVLVCLFTNLALRAREADNTAGLIGFGVLCVFFGGGLLVCSFHSVASLRSSRKTNPSTTN